MAEQDRSRDLIVATIKYGVALVIAGLLLPGLSFDFTRMDIVSVLLQFLIFPLAIAYVGRALEIARINGIGSFVKLVISPVSYTYLFFAVILSAIATSAHYPSLTSYVFPTVILFTSVFVLYYGTAMTDRHPGTGLTLIGIYSSKVSKFILLFSLGLYLSTVYGAAVLTPALMAASVTGFIVDSWVLTSEKNGKVARNLSTYFMNSGGRWIFLAALIGFSYGLLRVPKAAIYNEALFIAFMVFASIAVIYLILKIYVATSQYVDRIVAHAYKKYEYSSDLITNRELDYISQAARRFIMEGEKSSLIIAFSVLLSKRDLQFTEIDSILRPLTSYNSINAEVLVYLNIRKALESRMHDRHYVVQGIMNRISKMEESEPWKQETKVV